MALYRSNMYNRLCQKFFVFAYSADDQQFDWAIGRHSLITKNEMEAIYRTQIKNLDHVALAISNMISNLRINVVEKISKGLSDQHCHYQTNESLIVDPYGLLSDCEKIQIANQLTELQLQTRTYETAQFGFQVGDDSFLNRYDAKIILEKQAKTADASRWVDFISGLITSIQTGALKKLDTINDSGTAKNRDYNKTVADNRFWINDYGFKENMNPKTT
ncbi:hypothetical protein Ddc_17736 [Ditylenchus destructor]|nr:hypothetical protein Ddc_17736 [Ditylenchus destructor]